MLSTIDDIDLDIAIIKKFCTKIAECLDQAAFESKPRILDLLDAHDTLVVENDERVLYLTYAVYPQPVSLVLTSALRSNHKRQPIAINARLVIIKPGD